MKSNMQRIEENKFYILYRRVLDKKDSMNRYVIYRTSDYGGDMFEDFSYLTMARKIFKIATRQAVIHEDLMFV